MASLYDELDEKLKRDPSLVRRTGPRADIGMLLFSERDSIRELWVAADSCVKDCGPASSRKLGEAVDRLRRLFGERGDGTGSAHG